MVVIRTILTKHQRNKCQTLLNSLLVYFCLADISSYTYSKFYIVQTVNYMITNLDQLEEHLYTEKPLLKRRKWIKEAKIFIFMFLGIYSVYTVAVNFEVIAMSIVPQEEEQMVLTQLYQDDQKSEESITELQSVKALQTPEQFAQMQEQMVELKDQLDEYKPVATSDFEASQQLEGSLRSKINDYSIKFNRLPPGNRLIIPKISVDVPIQDVMTEKPVSEITKADYDKELYNGVVRYPTTATPSSKLNNGQTMLFGHTSYESWKKNEYGSVFAKIPALQKWDTVQSVWNGSLYTYRVIEKRVISPSKLDAIYNEFNDGNFISLVGCYPLWTTKERIVIIAELIPNDLPVSH